MEKLKNITNYTSQFIQDQLIGLCVDSVSNTIINEIGNGVFGIMCE